VSALSDGHPAGAGPPPAADSPLSVRLLSSREPGTKPDLELAAYLYLPAEEIAREAIYEAGAPDEPGNDVEPPLAPGLVVGHGAGSQAARHGEFCREACRQGFVVLALDFRGHGNSAGTGDGPLEQDVLAAARFLRDHPAVDGRHICYRGSSMGGFYGLKAQPEAGFAALVLLCPAGEDVILDALDEQEGAGPDIDSGAAAPAAAADIPRWNKPRLRAYFRQQDSRLVAARVHCPVLLVHTRPDTVVPFAHSLLLTQHLPADTTLLALAEGSHTSAQHDPAIHAYTIAWLRDRISRAVAGEIQAR
jgi:dipeptidyl aminopeptidase/acylaminoacyl peptidase